MYFIHVFVTMQTAAIPRAVFIKTSKKTTLTHEFKWARQEVKRMLWAKSALNRDESLIVYDSNTSDEEPFKDLPESNPETFKIK